MKYTIEEVQTFGDRLRINTVFITLFSALAAYIILKHSPSIMGNYKYYILSTVIFTFITDFHVTFIYGVFQIYPYAGGCAAGIAKYWGPFWGDSVQYGVFHFTFSSCALSVFFGLLYQYFSIKKRIHFLQTLRGGIFVGLVMLIFPIPLIIFYALEYSYPQFLEQLKANDPEMVNFFISASCTGHVKSKFRTYYFYVCGAYILFIHAIALIMVIKIVKNLSAEKIRLSKATLKMRQQYFRVLIIQLLLPIIFNMLPTLILVTLISLNVKHIDTFTQICYQFMSLHSVANALTVMIFVKPYRKILCQWFIKITLCSCNKNQTDVTNITVQ